jgi:L,D-transpeptidase catalytic domain/Putative peptidoglycan binding domain
VLAVAGPSPRRRRWPWVLGGTAAVLAIAAGLIRFAWPTGSLAVGDTSLPHVNMPRLGGSLERVSLRDEAGRAVPVALRGDGTVRPVGTVTPGTLLVAEVVFRRPSWVGWLAGRTRTVRLELTAPNARLEVRWLRLAPGAPVRVRFDQPVRLVRVTGVRPARTLRLPRPARAVDLGRLGRAGSVGVAAVPESWERLPRPTSVTWFPRGGGATVLASPAPGGRIAAGGPLRLRFSEPAATLLRGRKPAFKTPVPGRWRTVDTHTLEFAPRGYGFGLDTHVRLRLPVAVHVGAAAKTTRTIAWETPVASELRLEELLALLRYLPLRWTADEADAPRTIDGQLEAAVDPPRGRFTWRYPNIPPQLSRLWQPGRYNTIVRGAIMAFQSEHGLTVDGFAGRDVWRALIADVIAGKPRPVEYSYVYVHSTVPQSLNLWHAGQVILTSPGNTGVPAAPTDLGTFPVFEHIPVGTMSGRNPDGSHYNDPGVRYISYFNGGEGIHAFNRASFGTPQSLGCVELPLAAAAKVWPYTPIGTLVTVER